MYLLIFLFDKPLDIFGTMINLLAHSYISASDYDIMPNNSYILYFTSDTLIVQLHDDLF